MKHKFSLFIKDSLINNHSSNYFTIENKMIYNDDYQSSYKFDSLLLKDQYSIDELIKDNDIAQLHDQNMTFFVFGPRNSGKSSLLRGYQRKQSINSSGESKELSGLMLSTVSKFYNQLIDTLDSDDIIILKFGAFGKEISKDSNKDYANLLKENEDNSALNSSKKKRRIFDDVYTSTNCTSPCLSKSSYIVKKLSSFNNLTMEIKEVVKEKEDLYSAVHSYYILYHYSIEVKTKDLINKEQLSLNFFEINCEDCTLLQPILLELNTRIIDEETEEQNESQGIINSITRRNHINQNYVNILCMENESFDNLNVLNGLKMMRFLQLTFNRNDLYDNTAEICGNCCKLKTKLNDVMLTQEEMLQEINKMNEQADIIKSMVHSIVTYKKNSMKSPKQHK